MASHRINPIMARLYEIIYPKSFILLCDAFLESVFFMYWGFSVLCLVHFCFTHITLFGWTLGLWTCNSFEFIISAFSWPFLTSAFSWECSKTHFFLHSITIMTWCFELFYLLGGCLYFYFHLFVFLLGHFQLTNAKFLPSFSSMTHLLVMPHKCVYSFHKVSITLLCQIVYLLCCLLFTSTVLLQQPWLL